METKRCNFWLPNKKRFCANSPLNGSLFCGNHNLRSENRWIPCPIDPSHSVLEQNIKGHVNRCPLLKQVQSLSLHSFYRKGINAGSDGEQEEEKETSGADDSRFPVMTVSSEMKRNALHNLSVLDFCNLIEKIESFHDFLCKDIEESFHMPEVCRMWIKSGLEERKLPFQEKHILQQASILGNLENFGIFKNSLKGKISEFKEPDKGEESIPAVIEFGAGRGYMTQMLADCYGIKRVFLVERKAYKLKADRSLRKNESLMLERLRIDIEDLDLTAVESLHGVPFLAIGKHLCGAATDLTLRCCFPEYRKYKGENCTSNKNLGGVAIATCCHHLCQWKHYINKRYFLHLGMTKEEFHAITWLTSWAVDANHDSDLPDVTDFRSHMQSIRKEQVGEYGNRVGKIIADMEATKRAGLGLKCKRIIDMGRLMWLRECGFKATLVEYVPPSLSPENHLLIARPANHF